MFGMHSTRNHSGSIPRKPVGLMPLCIIHSKARLMPQISPSQSFRRSTQLPPDGPDATTATLPLRKELGEDLAIGLNEGIVRLPAIKAQGSVHSMSKTS